ncbi:AMP-binding protein [Rhodoferax sp. TS-BS-61-7]|uniref:AMP-binding protein n=1 Tax=Rhodoferax sp. TS-BS-61-7 TaxID=2094194 RepID=UPI000CF61292|nr:AMP-binding protein [Rhodoferax sp. TS-BS-61-7]PQA77695.1 long-chain fatty acid--CoA ligase [Rhodoferax sp. TS-BS-61-7]
MIDIDDATTIGQAFFSACARYATHSLLAVPANPARAYDPEGREITYAEAADTVRGLMAQYRAAGYGLGHRVGLFLESRPEHLLHKLALNSLGVCCVPINPDYRPRELAYLVDHARVDLVVVLAHRLEAVQAALALTQHQPPVRVLEALADASLPAPATPAQAGDPVGDTPASILYTSGTTGQPKGCVLSHTYELAAGHWYAHQGGLGAVREGQERLYNPLPLFHVNASILSFYCMLLSGGCQVQTDRFQPSRWWAEVVQSRATIVHYLGVVVPMLLNQPTSPLERAHSVRFGYGAGVEPQLHAVFEERYGFPLLELWGMTEMVRPLCDCQAPRQVGTRAFGRARPGLDACVMDEAGQVLPDGTPGELVIRHSAATPRRHFFSGYLDNPEATADAWRGGWFHTGDVVVRGADGMFHFMDRRKNIIRRSGENIAAAEVEALLLTHPLVANAAVMALPDDVREEEVLACVVLKQGAESADTARALFDFCHQQLAYYKAPGWLWFAPEIPTTGTQKIQKHRIFPEGSDPRTLPGMHDLRAFKKR